MKICTIYDLDGVLVESLEFERRVGEQIVQALCRHKHLLQADAERLWRSTLRGHQDHPRWHDYGLHCAALGLDDVWRSIHEQARQLIHPMPRALEALKVGRDAGSCFLASDATQWVVEFKLQAVGMDLELFDQVFTLDRCRASKGHREFWNQVQDCAGGQDTHLIYIDNRDDRLTTAADVLVNCSLVQVVAEDHPTSLGLFIREQMLRGVTVCRVVSSELPDLLESIIETVR